MESRASEVAEDQIAVMHLSIFIRMCVTEAESMATALSRSPLYVRGGHLHTNQCSTFTGILLVFGVLLILFEWLYW